MRWGFSNHIIKRSKEAWYKSLRPDLLARLGLREEEAAVIKPWFSATGTRQG